MQSDDFAIAATMTKEYPKDRLITGYVAMLVACATRYAVVLRDRFLQDGARDSKAVMENATNAAFEHYIAKDITRLAHLGGDEYEGLDLDEWRAVFSDRMLTQWKVAQAVDRQTESDVGISDLVDPVLEAWGIEKDPLASMLLGPSGIGEGDEYAGGQYL